MSTSQNVLTEFEESLRDATIYPENLLRCNEFGFALGEYRKKLVTEDIKLFKPWGNRAMVALDYTDENKPFALSEPMRDVETVKKIMPGNVQGPKCRYVFIHSRYSRDPLACSVEQMQYLLSHLQAMPAFVDHIITFHLREEPHMQTSMKVDDELHDHNYTSFCAPGRSGQRMQHCFNLIGVEQDFSESEKLWPYLMRQTAAYFSFDIVNGQTSWIIIKANGIIRKRIVESSQRMGKHRRCLNNHQDVKSSFMTALNAHLLIFEWCLENWAAYITFLEGQLQTPSSQQRLAQVSKLMSDDRIAETFSKNQPLHSAIRSRNTGLSERSQVSTRNSNFGLRRTPSLSRGNTIPSQRHDSGLTTANPAVNSPSHEVDLEKMYSFENLQKLHRLSDKIESARSIINQDIDVLTDMLSRFEDVMSTDEFKHHIKLEMTEVRDFFRGTRWCIRELGRWQTRLQNMSSGLEQTIYLFNATLQYKDMRTNAFFAQQAQMSTVAMEKLTVEMAEIALKTRQETNSMHIITIFTLIFLPGTFVAVRYGAPHTRKMFVWALTAYQTFFSSGVLDFDDYDGNLPMVESIGYSTKWAALKLFAVICLPLMGATLSVWGLWTWRQTKSLAKNKEGDSKLEKGILQ